MHNDVKQCADSGDIKGLRYIFVDSLDVDPTFEKYREDYEYCQNIPGLFEAHMELFPLTENEKQWNNDYWEKLKIDLLKNFSVRRFQHMMQVAKVVYVEKIKRISMERQSGTSIASDMKSVKETEKREVQEKVQNVEIKIAPQISRELQERRLEEERKKLAIENQKMEEEQRRQEERIRQRREELQVLQNQPKGGSASSKKVVGIVLLIVIVLFIIVLMVR